MLENVKTFEKTNDVLKVINSGFYFEKNKFLFKDLTFNLKDRQILSILGLNGQGKTTLMLCMMGVLKLKKGEISSNLNFAFLPQNFNVIFDYKVMDIVLMGRVKKISLFSKPTKHDIEISRNALNMLGVLKLENKNFNSLSGGQKQLVLFARAVASESKILFLDEPASALDLKNQDRVLSLIQNLQRQNGVSIVFTTHQPNHALAISDNTLILKKDLSYKFGKSKEILKDEILTSLYNVDIKLSEFDFENKKIPTITQIFSAQKLK